MKYKSTRGDKEEILSSAAIIRGLAPDRGLYVPERIPGLPCSLADLSGLSYKNLAGKILGAYFDDFSYEGLLSFTASAYDSKFDTKDIAPIAKTDKAYFLELWHGSTAAFKDMALSVLPWLLKAALRMQGEDKKIVILTATSGDTGKAALAGFADVEGTEIIVLYPKDGVSVVQERQMITQEGKNVHVFGIRGNFDEAQKGVKAVFGNVAFSQELAKRGYRLSSANSINIGRLIPQIAYYIYAYAQLLAEGELDDGERVNICVPTGNFGNILSAWYAKQMGLPVSRIICASNENRILTDFINTGVYDTRREFILTSSPSMDILVSSNLERLLWHLLEGESKQVCTLMTALEGDGVYDAGGDMKTALREFYGGYAEMGVSHAALAKLWHEEGYLIDTHTAVAYTVYLGYREKTGDETKTLIASTANPYKFANSVGKAIGIGLGDDEFKTMENLSNATGLKVPDSLSMLDSLPVLHSGVIEKTEIKAAVASVL